VSILSLDLYNSACSTAKKPVQPRVIGHDLVRPFPCLRSPSHCRFDVELNSTAAGLQQANLIVDYKKPDAKMSTTSLLSGPPASPRPDPTQSPASSAQRTAEAKKAFLGSLDSVGASIDGELEARAKNIHANAKALTKQEDDLRKQTKAVAKENDSLQKLLDKTKREVAGLGDLDSMMADLDADLAMLEETLRLAEESDAEHDHDHEHDEAPSKP